jgi:putative DNA methylase
MVIWKMAMNKLRLIETDGFPFEFISQLAERESWRKEIHRPIYYLHKWWAKRLGSVFRGILLGCALSEGSDLKGEFYRTHSFSNLTILDPFIGSGTTIGEAHKLGFTSLGRDINPVAVDSVRAALGPMDRQRIEAVFSQLYQGVGAKIRGLYRSTDSKGRKCDVLYYFWVMNIPCLQCNQPFDLFPSWIIARNVYPKRKPEVQILCPSCGAIFPSINGKKNENCPSCKYSFYPHNGTVSGAKATCDKCSHTFKILDVIDQCQRPEFRLYAKLILNQEGKKEYLRAIPSDHAAYKRCSEKLKDEVAKGVIKLPMLKLEKGYNTRQAMNYGFCTWRDFFNDRQLLGLGWLHAEISAISEEATRNVLLTLFSSVLEFNNLFTSYKGEGTGAVRHMFAHHILKPERTPIEANIWGTAKSSGSFSNLFRSRLLRAIEYRNSPRELNGTHGDKAVLASSPFSGKVDPWPSQGDVSPRAIYLSCGDSASLELPGQSVDLIVTDPPFFDNVHYSELADFFFAWQQLTPNGDQKESCTTRSVSEVQDSDSEGFAKKLQGVFTECCRVLKDDGLLVFTYHHSREEGWEALAKAILGAGFIVINSHPVKAEMSVAVPKSQAKEPIQLDIILVCRKASAFPNRKMPLYSEASDRARAKIQRMQKAGFRLSNNDLKIVFHGELLTTLKCTTRFEEAGGENIASYVNELSFSATY